MAKQALTFRLHIDGLKSTLYAFRGLPKEASKSLRERTLELSEDLADAARGAARRDEAPQTTLLIPTIKALKDRVPKVQVGGTRKVGRHQAPAYGVLFGSEFGMNRRSGWYAKRRYRTSDGHQYREHGGQQGYWFFPLVEQERDRIGAAWQQVAGDIISEWDG